MAAKPICKIPSCNKPSRSMGWCNPHYQRFYRLGDPLAGGPGKLPNGTLLDFLRSVVRRPPEHCVPWPFGRDANGYGIVTFRGRKSTAHRVAWELYHHRKMRADMHAAHEPIVCHARECVNPLHVREATPAENNADKLTDGTHNRGERQWRSKLSKEQVIAIKADFRLHREIADSFGIAMSTVSQIKGGQRWGWLDTIAMKEGF